ncbi:ABC transporter ATP-binding protein [Brevibacillus dissolubilis]|uniref:ABC transporter ATP-binding protein n=1 Tax=Brevibacillus dissolubilis TaxID=1844116 RepID=UPI0011175446|nr:ABC transporter ATP-binding protein [Brevibacillus dissolubilis]
MPMQKVLFSVKYSIQFIWNVNRSYFFLSALITGIMGLLPLTNIWLMSRMVNYVAAGLTDPASFKMAGLFICMQMAIALAGSLMQMAFQILTQKMEYSVSMRLKEQILQKVNRLPYVTLENPLFYDQYQRISLSQAQLLSILRDLSAVISSVIAMVSIIGYLFYIHWLLIVIFALCSIPIMYIEIRFGDKRYSLMRYLTPYNRKESYVAGLLNTRESLKEIRLFRLGDHLISQWSKFFLLNSEERLRLLKEQTKWQGLGELFLTLTYCFSGLFILYLVSTAKVKVGEFVAVLQSIGSLQSGLKNITYTTSRLYESSLYIEDLHSFMQTDEIKMLPNQTNISEINTISINQLSFRYPNQPEPAIQDISFQIQKGMKVAIVGENGSGKTSLIKCITNLYQVEDDMLTVNGVPLNQIESQSYQDKISVLFQDFIRYEFSVQENIGFGKIDEYDNLTGVQKAAAKTGIDSYIMSLPDQYQSLLGRQFDGGNELSGGQWQKIALSRALYRDSDVIILDEPTSALDPKSEVEIIESLFTHSNEKAILFITHRLGAACLADHIIVMKAGRIVEQGTHDQLLAVNGEYSRLYQAQAKWYTREKEVEECLPV